MVILPIWILLDQLLSNVFQLVAYLLHHERPSGPAIIDLHTQDELDRFRILHLKKNFGHVFDRQIFVFHLRCDDHVVDAKK